MFLWFTYVQIDFQLVNVIGRGIETFQFDLFGKVKKNVFFFVQLPSRMNNQRHGILWFLLCEFFAWENIGDTRYGSFGQTAPTSLWCYASTLDKVKREALPAHEDQPRPRTDPRRWHNHFPHSRSLLKRQSTTFFVQFTIIATCHRLLPIAPPCCCLSFNCLRRGKKRMEKRGDRSARKAHLFNEHIITVEEEFSSDLRWDKHWFMITSSFFRRRSFHQLLKSHWIKNLKKTYAGSTFFQLYFGLRALQPSRTINVNWNISL